MAHTNLKVLKPSRKKRQAGDIFVFQIKNEEYGFGRLISTSAKIGFFEDVHLIYIYKATSSSKIDIPELSPHELLIPPMGINQKPWTLGYFETVDNRPLSQKDVLPIHCFRDFTGRFYDENGNELHEMTEPCGEYGLNSYRTLDDAISQALGMPLVPDEY